MRQSIAHVRTSAAVMLLAVLLAGCGEDDEKKDSGEGRKQPTSNGIAEMEPERALRAAIRAHRKKKVVYEGRLLEYFPVGLRAFNVTLSATARRCEFRLSSDDLGAVTTRVIDEVRYTKASARAMSELYQIPNSAVGLLSNRWLKETAEDFRCNPVKRVTQGVDLTSCLPGPEGEVGGTPSVVVRCQFNATEYRFHIAATGKPLVLWLEQDVTSGDDLELVAHGSRIRIPPPPARDVVDTEALQ